MYDQHGFMTGIINQPSLVGRIPTPLKNMKVSWDDSSQYMGKHVPNHQPVNYFQVYHHLLRVKIPIIAPLPNPTAR